MNGNPIPPDGMAPALDTRRRRVLFRATHRGMQETDRLLGGFVAARITAFDEEELASVERVLELVDADLADWLMGRRPVPAEHDTPMLRAMLGAANRKVS
jgi:antitoxin CptB